MVERMKTLNDFDYLGVRNPSSKLHLKAKNVLTKSKESISGNLFSDRIFVINAKLKKEKRILIITETGTLYILSRNRLRLIFRIPLTDLKKLTLIKSSSALVQLSYVLKGGEGNRVLVETLKRTEFIVFVTRLADRYKWEKPKLIQTASLKIQT